MKKLLTTAAACACLLLAPLGFAADLSTLKRDGVVGERADGYLGFVKPGVPEDARDLVEEVNAKRRAEYERIAEKNGISLAEVESLAGRKTIEKTVPGGWVYDTEWRQK